MLVQGAQAQRGVVQGPCPDEQPEQPSAASCADAGRMEAELQVEDMVEIVHQELCLAVVQDWEGRQEWPRLGLRPRLRC